MVVEQSPQRIKIAQLKTWQEKWRLWPSLSALFARRMHGLKDSVYLFRFLLFPFVSFATIHTYSLPLFAPSVSPYMRNYTPWNPVSFRTVFPINLIHVVQFSQIDIGWLNLLNTSKGNCITNIKCLSLIL